MNKNQKSKALKFALSAAAVFCVVVIVMATVNYIIDPANIFDIDFKVETAQKAIEIIKSGQNAANMANYDERLVKRYAIYELEAHDTIVLGSSRAALISKDMAGDESFFNFSVTGASVYDIVSLYGLLYQQGKMPKRVILSLDLWWLNDNYMASYYYGAMEDGYYFYATERLDYTIDNTDTVEEQYLDATYEPQGRTMPWEARENNWQELFNVSYFQSSVESVFDDTIEIEPTSDYLGETGILRADGSYGYPRHFRESSAATITQLASDWVPDNVMGCEDYSTSGTKAQNLFYDFIKSLVDDGVEVDFVLTPINPLVYEHMEQHERYTKALEAEGWFLDVAWELSIDTAGSFNPDNVGAVLTDFYDAPHYRLERVAELVQQIN